MTTRRKRVSPHHWHECSSLLELSSQALVELISFCHSLDPWNRCCFAPLSSVHFYSEDGSLRTREYRQNALCRLTHTLDLRTLKSASRTVRTSTWFEHLNGDENMLTDVVNPEAVFSHTAPSAVNTCNYGVAQRTWLQLLWISALFGVFLSKMYSFSIIQRGGSTFAESRKRGRRSVLLFRARALATAPCLSTLLPTVSGPGEGWREGL